MSMYLTLTDQPLPPGVVHHHLREMFGPQRTLFRNHTTGTTTLTPLPMSDASVPLHTEYSNDESVRFRVRLNPIAAKSNGDQRGTTYVVPPEDRAEWAAKSLHRNAGLETNSINIHRSGVFRVHKGKLPIVWIDVEGTATVRDAAQLSAALTGGVGKAKSFGCGLLEVDRVRQIS